MNANPSVSPITQIIQRIFQLIIPVVLILTSVRIVLYTASRWIPIEYRMPGFPQDRFGFTLEDRIYWSSVDLKYLVSERGIEYFEEYRLESGEPMHNARELRHMEDVKVLLFRVWRVWGALSLIALGSLLWLLWKDGWTRALDAISTGAIWTLILIGAIAVGILFAFGVLFVGFHRIFFEGDTWLFLYSDTFIRLYPERFWRDTFILLASVNMLEALILLWLARWTRQRVG